MSDHYLEKRPLIPYSCTFIDAPWSQFASATGKCLRTCENERTRQQVCDEIGSMFRIDDRRETLSLVCLSVRTAFDLFLSVKRFPPESEVIMSAINIPGMVQIVKVHGLVAVPWDIEPDSLAPAADRLERLIGERTVAVVLAHLFGKRCADVGQCAEIAHRHQLSFIEDCAENFDAFDYVGHPASDLVLFSFGIIKYFTAFGGAVCLLADPALHRQMVQRCAAYPIQSTGDYLSRVSKYFLAAVVINVPAVMGTLAPVLSAAGVDYKNRTIEMLRGFPPGADIWLRIRRRPSLPLLLVLRDRLRSASSADMQIIKSKGQFVRRLLLDNGFLVPGRLADGHDWLFPIVVRNPERVVRTLNRLGVDAFTKPTQLTVIEDDRTHLVAENAHYFFSHVAYLPIHKNVPYSDLNKICSAVNYALSDDLSDSLDMGQLETEHDFVIQSSKNASFVRKSKL